MNALFHVRSLVQRAITVALLFSCMAMMFVVFEQSRTIESQRKLIHQLFGDSIELSAVRMQQRATPPPAAPPLALPAFRAR